ncbi:DnaJ family domain-containing protein [Paenibacillus spongiae]|uniref:DUF1992 domain-containing protein n=1 Tax=Paenibacillus spongiae TaxID=2909671 RepID=A0ABY5S112_9BACL|nr:DUF1992 domain-containing protein [Paenibacillus spongiae]UVI27542.1 DUF1992 domain-containing protein [Paenibacillus spongiae]
MFHWFKKKTKHQRDIQNIQHNDTTAVNKPVSNLDILSDEPAVSPVQFWNSGGSAQDWIGEMYNEQLKKGAFDHLPGKGAPMDVSSSDVMSGILKHNNVLPDWLTLQHEIRDQLRTLIRSSDKDASKIAIALNDLNKKIMKYNNMVPSPVLQKRKVSTENMEQQLQLWL